MFQPTCCVQPTPLAKLTAHPLVRCGLRLFIAHSCQGLDVIFLLRTAAPHYRCRIYPKHVPSPLPFLGRIAVGKPYVGIQSSLFWTAPRPFLEMSRRNGKSWHVRSPRDMPLRSSKRAKRHGRQYLRFVFDFNSARGSQKHGRRIQKGTSAKMRTPETEGSSNPDGKVYQVGSCPDDDHMASTWFQTL